MARRLYGKSLLLDCWITLGESNTGSGWPGYLPDPPAPTPEMRFGRSGLEVNTRCPDFGEVDLEVWAGDPGPVRPDWKVVFDGELETVAQGFDVAMMSIFFHIDASPGTYRIRAETHRGDEGYVDGVRFIFPESPDLVGETIN
jgi:hypothetical protein